MLLDKKRAQQQPTREERQHILFQWFPDGGFRYPGYDGRFIGNNIHLKSDPKDKWVKKYIELRENKILIFKVYFFYYSFSIFFYLFYILERVSARETARRSYRLDGNALLSRRGMEKAV